MISQRLAGSFFFFIFDLLEPGNVGILFGRKTDRVYTFNQAVYQ